MQFNEEDVICLFYLFIFNSKIPLYFHVTGLLSLKCNLLYFSLLLVNNDLFFFLPGLTMTLKIIYGFN